LRDPVSGVVVGKIVADTVTELGGALIMRVLDVGRNITEVAVTDRRERGINGTDP
jgi:hypothetical protein